MNDGIKLPVTPSAANNNNNANMVLAQKSLNQNYTSKQYNSSDIVNRFIKYLIASKGRQKQDSQDDANHKNKIFNMGDDLSNLSHDIDDVTFSSSSEPSEQDKSVSVASDEEPKMSLKQRTNLIFRELFTEIIRPNDYFKVKWDMMIMALSLFNCFSVPLTVAFQPEDFEANIFVYLNFTIDFMFFCDMLVTFRTAFIDDQGNEETRYYYIAKNYIRSTFIIDFLATVPFDTIL